MKNSPMSEASRVAALALSALAPANSLRSSRPSSTLVSDGASTPGSVTFVKRACPYESWLLSDTFQPAGTTKLKPPAALSTRPGSGGGAGGALGSGGGALGSATGGGGALGSTGAGAGAGAGGGGTGSA